MVHYTDKGWARFYEKKLKMDRSTPTQFIEKLNKEQLIKELSSKRDENGSLLFTQLLLLMYFPSWKLNKDQNYIFNGKCVKITHFCAGTNCVLVDNNGDTKFDYFIENATLEDGTKITVSSIVENIMNPDIFTYEIQYLILRCIDMKWLSKKVINK